jgi:hypothetical protein
MSSKATINDFNEVNDTYGGLVAFGLFLIIVELLMFLMNWKEKTFSSAMHLLLGVIGCFFNLWIALDGLDWRTYIYIVVFCL